MLSRRSPGSDSIDAEPSTPRARAHVMFSSHMQDFAAAAVVAASGGAPGLHLYTAPPKTVLRDGGATLLAAGLAPAAVVYVGGAADAPPPELRPEVAACKVHEQCRDEPLQGGFDSALAVRLCCNRTILARHFLLLGLTRAIL